MDNVPAFDDIPSFDDLPDAPSQQSAGAVPRFDDIPSFDALPDETNDGRRKAETPLVTGVREAAHGVVPAGAGLVGMGAGAAAGASLGPIGAIVGGVAGGVAASMGADFGQEKILNAVGFDDSAQRASNREENKWSAFAGGMAPAIVGLSPSAGASKLAPMANQLVQRGAGAGFGGAMEAGQEYVNEGHVDPAKVTAAAAVGAVLPGVNKVGQKFVGAGERFVPGRPGREANPAADQAHADVNDTTPEVAVGDSSLAQSPVADAGVTTGNPQSAPERSERQYGKGKEPAGPEGDMLTQGDADPATVAALEAANPAPVAEQPIAGFDDHPSGVGQAPREAPPVKSEEGLAEVARLQREAAAGSVAKAQAQHLDQDPGVGSLDVNRPAAAQQAIETSKANGKKKKLTIAKENGDPGLFRTPKVEAGFPAEGEPVAMGANDATPMPPKVGQKLTFNKIHEATDEGTDGRAVIYVAKDKAGKSVASLMANIKDGVATINDISRPIGEGGYSDKNAASNTLGPAVMRDLLRQFRAENPDVKVLAGNRVSGARAKGQYDVDATNPVSVKMPAFKGEAPINSSVTEGQRAAGNYPKARTHDFGKPAKVETHAGDMRTGKAPDGTPWEVKLPYDYGYFNKTKGADKDHIDFARPPEGDPAQGDKHFIIDQKNAETGKFDEHKLFTYYKDEAAAREHYEAGFSDGKGAERLGAITEVTRPDLVKFLAKHSTRAASKPFGALDDLKGASNPNQFQKKPAKDRVVVQDLVQKLEAAGKTDEAAKLQALPDDQLAAATAGKRLRKYGVGTGASAGYPVEGVLNAEGKPVTANTKAKAAERSAAHKSVVGWFEKTAPKNPEAEGNGALLDRIKQSAPNIEAWKPSHKPKEWMLAREAQRVLMKPTDGNIKKFREAERLLRGGDEAVENYRGGNRVEADIARSRRTGDEAVSAAENKLAARNNVEDEMIAAIDAKKAGERKPGFDVPHEEAESMVKPVPVKTRADLKELPRKTVDVNDSSLAKINTGAISKDAMRKAEAAALAGKKSPKAAGTESEGAASPVKRINIGDPAEHARLIEAMNKAAKKNDFIEPLAPEAEPKVPRAARDLFDQFVSDERGSVNIGQIAADWKRLMNGAMKRTEPKSYRAMELRTPHDEYFQSLSDDLHKINNEDKNHWIGVLQKIEAMPKELTNEKVMEGIYHARDKDSANFPLPAGQTGTHVDNLPPAIKALYDKHLKPLLDANDAHVAAIRSTDPDRIGPDVLHHIARITKGDTSEYNILRNSGDDPTAPPVYSGLSVSANAAKLRKFYALERASDGRRFVVSPDDSGFTKWENYKREKIKDPTFEFEDGKAYKAGPVDYTMRQATTKEIMDHARGGDGTGKPMKYYTNAGFSAAVSNAQLGSMARHLQELARISDTPQFRALSTRNRAKADKEGWQKTTLPNFDGTYMHPELKAVFDDFAGHPQNGYRKLNSAITKMLFWMPTAHINNVAAHWIVGRGWDNLSVPKNLRMVFEDFPRAVKSVVNQDDYQMKLRSEGAGTIYGSVKTRDMMTKIGKAFQMEIEQNPSKWGPIADKIGVPLKALGRGVYDTSSKVMWAVNDMFLTQRVMELERKGVPMKKAIVEAERDIPNYRLPHKIIGRGDKGRMVTKITGDPAVLSFGRYHYGMFNSYANIVKDAIGPKATLGDRVDAAGKLLTLGLMGLVIYPALDKGAQWVTGNEHAKSARRGPLAIPEHLAAAATGKEDISSAARATFTVPPVVSTAWERLHNKDFRGKSINEPGDVAAAVKGSGPAAARVAVQAGEHLARGLVSPYSTFANATKKAEPDASTIGTAARAVRDQALDIKDPSKKAIKYERMAPITNNRDSVTRFKHGGSGPLENLVNKTTGYR